MPTAVAVEVILRSRFDLRARIARARGLANAMGYTIDTFSVDTESQPRRGNDLEIVAWLRKTADGLGAAGATGDLHLWLNGCELSASPYAIPADADRGDGWLASALPGGDFACRGIYKWLLIGRTADGGQASAGGSFRLE